LIYIKNLILPSAYAEIKVIKDEQRTWLNTFYPFKIFPEKGLPEVEFESVTMLYGGNGSGKSTLINVLAEKINANRYSEFNAAPLFGQFVDMCRVEYNRSPRISSVLTSDDVFRYVLNARRVNEDLGDDRDELVRKYVEVKNEVERNPEIMRLKGLDDYERWKTAMEILSPRRSQSSYIKKRVAGDVDLRSNGETAMRYFIDRTEEEGLYLLDEPENSLSIEYQIQLAEYIEATARATKTQFIIATHSPILLAMKNAKIYNLDDYPASVCRWTELPNVRRYFDFFMSHREEFD
jgi:predicted ATPase